MTSKEPDARIGFRAAYTSTARQGVCVPSNRPNLFAIYGLGLALLAALGCQKESREIRSYTVPTERPPFRMIVAMMPHNDQTWFFKLTGPIEKVNGHEKAFKDFICSVTFTDETDKPVKWKVPADWRQEERREGRYATFRLDPSDDWLELTVVPLPRESGTLAMNVNRWSDQLGLGGIGRDELVHYLKEFKDGDRIIQMVDMAGPGPAVTYRKPADWKVPQDKATMQMAAFQVGDGDKAIEVSITPLPGASGTLLENVNRWRGQIQLGPIKDEQLKKDVQELRVGGVLGHYTDLIGRGSAKAPPERIIGAIVTRGKQTWFFKMRGPVEPVGQQKAAFDEFLKTVRFRGSRGATNG